MPQLKILITGGLGFIGSHLAYACADAGYEVVVVDNFRSAVTAPDRKHFRFYKADINNVSEMTRIFTLEKPDIVSHHAAHTSVPRSFEFPDVDAEENIMGTIRVLNACKLIGVKRFVFASSGGAIDGEIPSTPYGRSKRAAELYVLSCGIPAMVLRYSNVYGPRQRAGSEGGVVATFFANTINNDRSHIYGDGEQTRDFVYIEDVVDANLAAIESDQAGIENVSTGVETSINELHKMIRDKFGGVEDPLLMPARIGDKRNSVVIPTNQLMWFPRITLSEGLDLMMEDL